MAPAITMRIDSTAALIGRSMKDWAIFMTIPWQGMTAAAGSRSAAGHRGLRAAAERPAPAQRLAWRLGPARAQRRLLGRDLLAGAHALQAVDDDAVAGLQARADHAQAVEQRTKVDALVTGLAVLVDHVDEAMAKIGADGARVDQHRRPGLAAGQAQAREQARYQGVGGFC